MSRPLSSPVSARGRATSARIQICIGLLAVVALWAALLTFSSSTRLAARTLALLPSFFVALPGSPLDLVTDKPAHEVVELPPVDGYVRAHVYRPPKGRHPALVLTLGLGPAPPDDPRVVRLLDGLARTGLVAVLVESETLNLDQLHPDLPQALIEAVQFTAGQGYVRADRVGLFGFSVGGSLALIAASEPPLRDTLRLVDAFGAYATLDDALVSVATHTIDDAGTVRRWEPDSVATHHLADALVADLTDPSDAEALRRYFVDEAGEPPDRPQLSAEGGAIYDLLTTRDRDTGVRLTAALPVALRENVAALSPLAHVSDVRARQFVMYDRGDPLLPFTGSRTLCTTARTSGARPYCSSFAIFQHVDPTRMGNPVAVAHDLVELYMHVFALLRQLQ